MNTNHIPILMEVFYCRSINKAAQNLFISQPQISHIIRSVEEGAGFPIFHRTSTGMRVTPQGELFLDSLRIVSGELKKDTEHPRPIPGVPGYFDGIDLFPIHLPGLPAIP